MTAKAKKQKNKPRPKAAALPNYELPQSTSPKTTYSPQEHEYIGRSGKHQRTCFDKDAKELNTLLREIDDYVTKIEWQYSGDGSELYLNTLGGPEGLDPVTFTTFKSAKAFLDGYTLGHKHGSEDRQADEVNKTVEPI